MIFCRSPHMHTSFFGSTTFDRRFRSGVRYPWHIHEAQSTREKNEKRALAGKMHSLRIVWQA